MQESGADVLVFNVVAVQGSESESGLSSNGSARRVLRLRRTWFSTHSTLHFIKKKHPNTHIQIGPPETGLSGSGPKIVSVSGRPTTNANTKSMKFLGHLHHTGVTLPSSGSAECVKRSFTAGARRKCDGAGGTLDRQHERGREDVTHRQMRHAASTRTCQPRRRQCSSSSAVQYAAQAPALDGHTRG